MSIHQLDDYRRACACMPWDQRWRADRPELCLNCGGLFPARTVPARRLSFLPTPGAFDEVRPGVFRPRPPETS